MSRRRALAIGGAALLGGAGAVFVGASRESNEGSSAAVDSEGVVSTPSLPAGAPAGAIVPDVAADGRTDDRAAIQSALDNAPVDRPCTVWIPGLCYIDQGGASGGAPYGILVERDDVTLTGPPGAGLISRVARIRLVVVSGIRGGRQDPLDTERWITRTPVVPFGRAIGSGETLISLAVDEATPRLRRGDLVFLRTGQLLASARPREPDAELNMVVRVSGPDVRLAYPTAKPYAPERFTIDAQSTSEPDGTGPPAPWGIVRATDRVVRNCTIRGLRLLAHDEESASDAVHLLQAWGVRVENCSIEFGKYGIAARYSRDVTIVGSTVRAVGDGADRDPAWIAPSTGCTQWTVENCRGGGTVPAKIHAHEGVADFRVLNWWSQTPDGPGEPGASNVSVRARAYRHLYELDMTGAYSAAGCAMVRVTSSVVGPPEQVQFRRLKLRGSAGLAMLYIESGAVAVYREGLDLPTDARIVLADDVQPFL